MQKKSASVKQVKPEVRFYARELRHTLTNAELSVWKRIRSRQLAGYKFRRQEPLEKFIVDFYCAQAKLAIEIDGDTHGDQAEYDQSRTEWLEANGIRVIRFTNQEVYENLNAVLEKIAQTIEQVFQE